MKIDKKGIARFFKYSTVGVGTFVFDVLLLYILVSVFSIHYLVASGIAFFIALSVNYFISRELVFRKTSTSYSKGYVQCISIALVGVLLTVAGMYILVTAIGMHYLFARCLISLCVGIGNYLFNLYFNFKVVGQH